MATLAVEPGEQKEGNTSEAPLSLGAMCPLADVWGSPKQHGASLVCGHYMAKRTKRRCIPNHTWLAVVARDGMRCRCCRRDVRVRSKPREHADECLEMGHITPVSLGGDNLPGNLVVMCQRCNRSLGARVCRLGCS